MASIGRAPRRTVGAKDIRDFQLRSCQRGLWRAFLTLFAFGLAKIVQRAFHRRDHARGNACIPRRRGQFGVSQQRLNDPDIDAALKQVCRKLCRSVCNVTGLVIPAALAACLNSREIWRGDRCLPL